MTVPNGSSDTATFDTSNQTTVSLSAPVQANGIVFNPGATGYTINIPGTFVTISGVGITNNSATTQTFLLSVVDGDGGSVTFQNTASAGGGNFVNSSGTLTTFSNSSGAGNGTFTAYGSASPLETGGEIDFFNTSTASSATLTAFGATASNAFGGTVGFYSNSTAANASITVNGADAAGGRGALALFFNSASAAASSVTVNGTAFSGAEPGFLVFRVSSTAANATLIANTGPSIATAGKIRFLENSLGAQSRIKVFGNGNLEAGSRNAPGISVGSIEGDGYVFVGSNVLTVGTNNASTTFSGHIQDTGGLYVGSGGSLIKTGTGTLSLTNSNTYTGGTTINDGVLEALHDQALGPGNMKVGSGSTLTLDDAATNNYIADNAILSIATTSTVNLDFTGDPDRIRSLIVDGVAQPPGLYGSATSGAPNQLPQFAGPGTILVTTAAVSRQIHDAAGSFDVDLPLTGPVGIECRNSGGIYQVVVSFFNAVTFDSASITSGSGMVASTSGNGSSTVTVNLTGVANAQTIKLTLFNVNDGTNTSNLVIPMGVLVADTNDNGSVNASDVTEAKAQIGAAITSSNFRNDVNLSGSINASDAALIKSKIGTFLP